METKHTTGEWLAKEGQIYSLETGKTLALIPYFDNEDEQIANSLIMAAAPELLKSLRELLSLLEENEPIWYLRGHYNHALKAIHKATE